ncbi:MAG: DUF2271 domain-containing protein [bacterium]|nr:DUF2271 domain-containing protein [bacterium]
MQLMWRFVWCSVAILGGGCRAPNSGVTFETAAEAPAASAGGISDTGGVDVGDPSGTGTPAGAIQYELQTVSYAGKYDPDHVVAIWIEQDGAFVRTLEVHADKRLDHLIAWRTASGEDTTDAITGPTIKDTHIPLSGTWDLRDSAGTTMSAGDYVLHAEFTSDDSNDGKPPGPVLGAPFTLGPDPIDVTPADSAAFVGVHIWSE